MRYFRSLGPLAAAFSTTAFVLVLAGCTSVSSRQGPTGLPKTAAMLQGGSAQGEAVLRQMEEELMTAPAIRAKADITGLGLHHVAVQGLFFFGPENSGGLEFGGSFDGQTLHAKLTEMGGEIWGGAGSKTFRQLTPAELRASLVLGLTRTGLLHNIARLREGQPPEHAEGGVSAWAEASDVQLGEQRPMSGGVAQSLTFKIRVEGKEVGEAVLWLDRQSGAPLMREQKVHFPEGDLTTVETYTMTARWAFSPPVRH